MKTTLIYTIETALKCAQYNAGSLNAYHVTVSQSGEGTKQTVMMSFFFFLFFAKSDDEHIV
jgi:hypothetical protein